MKKYVFYLQDSPTYPNKILASSKMEAKKLILDSIGPDNESMILNIIEENENNTETAAIYADSIEYNNSTDFFNDVINAGKIVGQHKNELNENKEQPQIQNTINQINNINHDIKYFEEGGFQFKLENGKVYKKNWINVTNSDEYRIVSSLSKKPIKSDKYEIEKLDWVEL